MIVRSVTLGRWLPEPAVGLRPCYGSARVTTVLVATNVTYCLPSI